MKTQKNIHSNSVLRRARTMKPNLIAPCGMNCRLCIAYNRDKNTCPGCFMVDAYQKISRSGCRIRNCLKRKQAKSRFCFVCDNFLICFKFSKYSMSMIENLKQIKKLGIREFIRKQKSKWLCPNCGYFLSVHRDNCLSCNYKWR